MPLYLILYTCLGYFHTYIRPAITLFTDGNQRIFVSIGFNADNFIHFWVLNPVNKIKQQQKSKPTPSQKKSKVGKVADFLVQISSVSNDQFCWLFGRGISISDVQKREQWNCADLYCRKYNWRELKLHLSSKGDSHSEVGFLFNVCRLGLVEPTSPS